MNEQDEKAKGAPAGGSLTAVGKERRVLAAALGRTAVLGREEAACGRMSVLLRKRRELKSGISFLCEGQNCEQKDLHTRRVGVCPTEPQDDPFTRHLCLKSWTAEEEEVKAKIKRQGGSRNCKMVHSSSPPARCTPKKDVASWCCDALQVHTPGTRACCGEAHQLGRKLARREDFNARREEPS